MSLDLMQCIFEIGAGLKKNFNKKRQKGQYFYPFESRKMSYLPLGQ